MPEIIPCPFCGVAPQKVRWGKVRCENPKCPIQPKNRSWWDLDHEAEAIAEWNTRKTPVAPVAPDVPREVLPLLDLDDGPAPMEDA